MAATHVITCAKHTILIGVLKPTRCVSVEHGGRDDNTDFNAGYQTMTNEKTKRSLRRLKQRVAARRRQHLAALRLLAGPRLVPATVEPRVQTGHMALRHTGRQKTRQELRVLDKFRTAISELGLF